MKIESQCSPVSKFFLCDAFCHFRATFHHDILYVYVRHNALQFFRLNVEVFMLIYCDVRTSSSMSAMWLPKLN